MGHVGVLGLPASTCTSGGRWWEREVVGPSAPSRSAVTEWEVGRKQCGTTVPHWVPLAAALGEVSVGTH